MSLRTLMSVLAYEHRANRREFKTQFVLFHFRVTQFLMRDIKRPSKISYPAVLAYRIMTEWFLGLELRPTTTIGKGLRIFHGFGLVVNPGSIIGEDVILRNGVVVGNRGELSGCPTIGDRVEIGANALVLGAISVGPDAKVGAGSVVVKSLPPEAVAVGNPARVIDRPDSGEPTR